MGGACSAYGGDDTKLYSENLKGSDNLEDLDVDVSMSEYGHDSN
jgi:hypothetical protein